MEDEVEIKISAIRRLKTIKSHLEQSEKYNKNKTKHLYTYSTGALTEEQRDFYEKNGYLLIKNLISSEKLEKYKKRFQEICANKIQLPGMLVMKDVTIAKSEFLDGEKAITKIQDFTNDDELFEYCCLPELTEYVKSFIGPNVMGVHTMLINKPPGSKTKIIKIDFL
jgi:phytanoyl-CoA hydroxylase